MTIKYFKSFTMDVPEICNSKSQYGIATPNWITYGVGRVVVPGRGYVQTYKKNYWIKHLHKLQMTLPGANTSTTAP